MNIDAYASLFLFVFIPFFCESTTTFKSWFPLSVYYENCHVKLYHVLAISVMLFFFKKKSCCTLAGLNFSAPAGPARACYLSRLCHNSLFVLPRAIYCKTNF